MLGYSDAWRELLPPHAGGSQAIHVEVLVAHGGAAGVRDEALLESAAAPQATMMGETLFTDPLEIAGA